MKLTYLGHACFALEQDGYRLLMDPYDDSVDGYAPLKAEAHEVLCSHGHFDHSAVDRVTLLPPAPSPFTVRKIASFHDEKQGALRGANTIHKITAGGRTVVHLGDLGHPLTAEQIAAIGQVDVLLVPVGGTYTVDPRGAKQVCDALQPRCIVPMHCRVGKLGFPVLADREEFLALWPETAISRPTGNAISVTEDLPPVAALTYQK